MVEGLTTSRVLTRGQDRVTDRLTIDESKHSFAAAQPGTAPAEHVQLRKNPGDSSGEATPVPIPNTEVKLSSAEDTERAAFRENRSSPGFLLFGTSSRIAPPPRYPEPVARAGAPSSRATSTASRALAVVGMCPYLVGDDGWKSVAPSGRHRCGAYLPHTSLTPDKQRRLCLVPNHIGCPTYQAARGIDLDDEPLDAEPEASSQDRADTPPGPLVGATAWAFTRSDPVLLDQARFTLPTVALRPAPNLWQGGLAVLMVVAFVVLFSSRLAGPGVGEDGFSVAGANGTPAVAGATGRPSATPRSVSAPPRSTSAPAASAAPASPSAASAGPSTSTQPSDAPGSAGPRQTPPPPGSRTYTVRSGDTLSAIAARYGTTAGAIAEFNQLEDASVIGIGQVLKIP
jgi:LysM repeat protein